MSSSNYLTDGTKYFISVLCTDGTKTVETEKLQLLTYTRPTISTTIDMTHTSPQNAVAGNTFTVTNINKIKWSGNENSFVYQYRIVDNNENSRNNSDPYRNWQTLSDISLNYTDGTLTWYRTAEQIRELIPKQYDTETNRIEIRALNTSANNWESINTAKVDLVVYYRPLMDVTEITTKKNDMFGSLINRGEVITNTLDLSNIYVDWTRYDLVKPEAGYTQGYRVRLYDYKKDIVNTYYTTSKNIAIPKTDIPRINATYIDITPYFGNDQPELANSKYENNYWYYEGEITLFDFLRLVTELPTPTIDYPVNKSNWINKDFRVCFILPEDPDFKFVLEDYRYENLEIKINDTYIVRITDSEATTGGSTKNETIFNSLSTQLTHKRKIIVWPNKISGLPDATTYNIQIRVKKKYGTTSTETRWSKWSDIRTFTVTTPYYDVQKLEYIMASHYNGARALVDRIQNTYDVGWENIPNEAIAHSTVITASQYSQENIMNKLNETKTKVNTYGDFDTGRNDIKFDVSNKLPATFPENKQNLFISAAKEDSNAGIEPKNTSSEPGRNYIRHVYERAILLK